VILIDANLLLYAYHPRSEQHEKSRSWLESVLAGPELVRFAWLTLWAFLRIATNSRVFARPLSTSEAEAAISSWLAQPAAGILEPGDRHWDILRDLVRDGQATGPLVMDAVLAAIAVEHGALLCTTDRDFARFSGLRWANPLVGAADLA
jgi:toxin-antitoxin system PIN domain toxin